MPWCDGCSKFWNSPELQDVPGGQGCPLCGVVLHVGASPVVGASPIVGASPVVGAGQAAGVGVVRPAEPGASPLVGVEAARPSVPASLAAGASRPATKGAPWHFKLLVVGVTGYMVYRIYWLIEWLPKHL